MFRSLRQQRSSAAPGSNKGWVNNSFIRSLWRWSSSFADGDPKLRQALARWQAPAAFHPIRSSHGAATRVRPIVQFEQRPFARREPEHIRYLLKYRPDRKLKLLSASYYWPAGEPRVRLRLCRMVLAFSSALFRPGAKFLPGLIYNHLYHRIAEPIPPGETSLRAMMRATSSAGLVKVPGGGKVDSLLILADHLRLRGMGVLPPKIRSARCPPNSDRGLCRY